MKKLLNLTFSKVIKVTLLVGKIHLILNMTMMLKAIQRIHTIQPVQNINLYQINGNTEVEVAKCAKSRMKYSLKKTAL